MNPRGGARVLGLAVALAAPVLFVAPAAASPQHGAASHGAPSGAAAAPGEALADELLVIGHRGAAGYSPEHTLASYELAARMGADYIEPDVVSTKDGVLVARHENDITGTTDVEAHGEFADRKTTKTIDGQPVAGWFTEDFTLAELRTLRAEERLPDLRDENTLYDGLYQVPTLDEVLALRAELSRELGREIGVYVETKHPTYFDGIGLSLEEPLLADLREAKLDKKKSPVFIQSFETTNLRQLDAADVRVPLVQLIGGGRGGPADVAGLTYDQMSTAEGLAEIATYADGIGPDKNRVIPVDAGGTLGEPTSLVDDAHGVGLLVHPYTFRNENTFLPPALQDEGEAPDDYGQALEEHRAFWEAGIDGMFTDNPDTGVLSRDLFEG